MKLIVGNWKMYPQTIDEAMKIVVLLKGSIKKIRRVNVVVCPPALFIHPLIREARDSSLAVGAQDTFFLPEGAYTGEISPVALHKSGVRYVIVGHSERRALGEDDAEVAKKVIAGAKNKLTVILCVGEATRDDAGAYFTEVGQELRSSLAGFPKSEIARLVIAYEPIWAIGAKALRAARPEDFREMNVFIRRNLVDRFGKKAGFVIPILYGGSVDERNAGSFLEEGGADGLLVGRASLDPKKFSAIVTTASGVR